MTTRLDYRSRKPINTVAGRPAAAATWAWITHVAFALALAVVVARLTSTDVVRDAFTPTPGGDPSTHGPSPATGVALDLLAAVPALLVLARRTVDRDYRLVNRLSTWALLPLVAWMALSTAWSADRFVAILSTCHFAGGACLLWAASQLVRSWDRLRVVAAVCLGLLLALAVYTTVYRLVDVANTRAYWAEHKGKFLADHGWAPDSFMARQFEHKLVTGEQSAFFDSANTLAAVGVLLAFAAAAIGVQRALDDRNGGWLTLTGLAVVAGVWVLVVARSKTSAATPVIGVGVLLLWWVLRDRLRRRPTAAYAAGVAVVAVGVLAVVAQGVRQHGLFPGHFANSLDFRWKYWTASAAMVHDRPLLGTGWGNFGQSYLAHRVPEAAEEIKDPHDFLVRFAAELGGVGLLLAVAWLLLTAWEMTRPNDAVPTAADRPPRVTTIAWVAVVGTVLAVAVSLDTAAGLLDDVLLLMRPLLLLAAVLLGGIAAAMRSSQSRDVDNRPAPWIATALTVGLGLFLLHNLIDFGWFEPGPGDLFMLLIGARLGLSPQPATAAARPWAIGTLAIAGVTWATVAAAVAVPVTVAGIEASAADDLIRAADPSSPSLAYRHASAGYESAAEWTPYDAALLTSAARSAAEGGNPARARLLAVRATQTDPKLIEAQLLAAGLAARAGDAAAARSAYDAAVRLDPNDVPIRLSYANALLALGDRRGAAAQYRAALAANAALPPDEPRRLPPDRVTDLTTKARG